jgi:primosomal protein N' (replication factor Y)
VGSIVRVPLSGRKSRGFVVELADERDGTFKDLTSLSSQVPVFDQGLLKTLQWAATHYVAPLAVLLERAAPPNLPVSPVPEKPAAHLGRQATSHPLHALTREIAAGRRRPSAAVLGSWKSYEWLDALLPVLEAERSVMVVVATETEANLIGDEARGRSLEPVVASGVVARDLTAAWTEAQGPGRLLIGSPRVATWHVPHLALAVVLEEGRRAMKDRQTPTLHVRDILSTRSRVEGFTLVFIGPTPSLEVLASGPEIVRLRNRAWPLVEVVDRREDPPGSGFLAERTVAALRAGVSAGRRAFVFTHRRAGDSSMRCLGCRRVRVCEECGSRLGRDATCRRCGRAAGPCPHCGGNGFEEMGSEPERLVTEVNRRLGGHMAAIHPTDLPVAVGTERDLPGLEPAPLVVAVDVDGLMLGHNYRTTEEAMRILARLANVVEPGSGRRMMAQTSLSDAALVTALRRGDPMSFLEGLLAERARLGLPPATEMLAIEIRGADDPATFDEALRGIEPPTLLGPAPSPHGWRWLLQGSLGQFKVRLRPLVQKWRESGATVRLDADPIDL